MVRVIYFDYHGVLDRHTYRGLLETMAREIDDHRVEQTIDALRDESEAYMLGRLSPHVYWHNVERRYGAHVSAAGRGYILRVAPVLEVWQLLNTLKDRFALGLCADCGRDQKDVIRSAYALTDYFDFLIFSCDVQFSKHDVEFYELMRQHGQFAPDECLLIDDVAGNTAQAEQLGFLTHTYRDPETLRTYLETL